MLKKDNLKAQEPPKHRISMFKDSEELEKEKKKKLSYFTDVSLSVLKL
jgi:hypothetical protein